MKDQDINKIIKSAQRWSAAAVAVSVLNLAWIVFGIILRHYNPDHWLFRDLY